MDLRQQAIERILSLGEEDLQKVIDWVAEYQEQHKNQQR